MCEARTHGGPELRRGWGSARRGSGERQLIGVRRRCGDAVKEPQALVEVGARHLAHLVPSTESTPIDSAYRRRRRVLTRPMWTCLPCSLQIRTTRRARPPGGCNKVDKAG
jgi:hypothetical protein